MVFESSVKTHPDKLVSQVYDFLTHFVVFDDCFLLDDRKIHPRKDEHRGSISNAENEMKKRRKTFYSYGFHEWEAHNQFTPFLLLPQLQITDEDAQQHNH